MTVSMMLLHLAGAVTLLIWAVRMVRTGVERAHGAALRRALRSAKDSRIKAAATGTLAAVLLQSSTAVALLAAGFAASGILALPVGIAMMLGADLGSALVVRILAFDISILIPVLLVTGGVMFLNGQSREVKQTGRILVGIALVLLSLRLMGEATAPLRDGKVLALAVNYLTGDFITAFLLGAAFTWLLHSSVGSILLFVTLAAQGVLPAALGFSLMLGANFGGGLIGLGLTRGSSPSARRIVLGNALFRGLGALAALFAVNLGHVPGHLFADTAPLQIVNAHLAFNIVLLIVCLPLTGLAGNIATTWIRDEAGMAGDLLTKRFSALDRTAIKTPNLALASAKRELLRMSDIVGRMLRPVMQVYDVGDKALIREIRALDDEVDQAHAGIKLYLMDLSRSEMDEETARSCFELADFAVRLEHAGDIVVKDLLRLAEKKNEVNLAFSDEGWTELTDLHDRVVANLELALNVLVSGDRESARQLVKEKDHLRELERLSNERHLKRLREGSVRSIESSEIHLETIRHLKQINSLIATVAYPILSDSGELLGSRLTAAG